MSPCGEFIHRVGNRSLNLSIEFCFQIYIIVLQEYPSIVIVKVTKSNVRLFPPYVKCVHMHSYYFVLLLQGLTKHKQLEVLNKFKSGVHKCIVATAVASEGIDIPECNMMIRYRFTANEITSCQMRG